MTYTDEHGNFALENLRPGIYWLVAFGKGFQNRLRKDIVVEPNKLTEIIIVAPKEASKSVKGKVLNEEGIPLANVRVRIREQRTGTAQIVEAYSYATTDEEGNFIFSVYTAGRYDLTVYVDGFEPAKVNGVIVGDESIKPEFVVRLKRALRMVEGKSNAEVQVLSAEGKPMPQVWVVPVREWDWQMEKAQFTNQQGKVRFTGLPVGSYFFFGIATQPDLPVVASSPTVAVVRDQETKISFSFPLTGRIVGKLVDERGNPIAGEAVEIWSDEERHGFPPYPKSTVTKRDGSFVFESVPKGLYTLSTFFESPSGIITATQSVFVRGGETVKVTVKVYSSVPTTTIEGEVIDSNGDPVPNAVVFVYSEPISEVMQMLVTDEKGQFVLPDLPTLLTRLYGAVATYSIAVQKQGFAAKVETVKVEAGKKVKLRLMMEPGAVVEGQLLDEKGEPVGGMPVYIVPLEFSYVGWEVPGGIRSAFTDEKGWFVFRDLASGKYQVFAFVGNLIRTNVAVVEVSGGKSAFVKLRIQPLTPFVRGQVVGTKGVPIANTKIHLLMAVEWESVFRGQTDAEGRFESLNIPAGVYYILAEAKDWAKFAGKFTFEPNKGQEGICIVLPKAATIVGRVTVP